MAQCIVLELSRQLNGEDFTVSLYAEKEGVLLNARVNGTLSLSKTLRDSFSNWQSAYLSVRQSRAKKVATQTTSLSASGKRESSNEFRAYEGAARELDASLNQWLNRESSASILQALRDQLQQLGTSEEIEVLIKTDEPILWQLPWHLWDAFKSYRNVEVVLRSAIERSPIRRTIPRTRDRVRILVIQGNSAGIDTRADLDTLKTMLREKELQGEVELVLLLQPNRYELYGELWSAKGWDIIFFAGHSRTDWYGDQSGRLEINDSESLTIPELKCALRSAIALGLKLAIFNSCDGLGLARNLAELSIPHVVVMREEVADQVAQAFVRVFLKAFAEGFSLYAAVRQARVSLRELEDQYPCASWLPVICQNPVEEKISWNSLSNAFRAEADWQGACRAMLALDALERLKSNVLVQEKGLEIEDIYIPLPLGLMELQDEQSRRSQLSRQLGYPIKQKYEQREFFEEVLRFGRSSLSQGRRLIITGEPGGGKTSLLQRIAEYLQWEGAGQSRLVIWISLANLQPGQSLENYVLDSWLPRVRETINLPDGSSEVLKRAFAAGQVWLLLDGLDEWMSSDRNPLLNVVEQIVGSPLLSLARVILTCRLQTWEMGQSGLQGFDTFRQLELSYGEVRSGISDQVQQFIDRWFAGKAEWGRQLRRELESGGRERIKDLARSPLQLSFLCLIWEQGGEVSRSSGGVRLPETKAELYQRFTDAFYTWKQLRIRVREGQVERLNHRLMKLARFALEQNGSPFRIRERDVRRILGSEFSLALQVGWLNSVGAIDYRAGEAEYSFFHPTFQEYFAAKAVDGGDWDYFLKQGIVAMVDPTYGNYRVFQRQWRDVILLWFGRQDITAVNKENFLRVLWCFQDRCRGFYSFQAQFLAAAALGEFKGCNADLAEEMVTEIIDLSIMYYINDEEFSIPYKAVQERACRVLLQTDKKRTINGLMRLLARVPQDGSHRMIALYLGQLSPGSQAAIEIHIAAFLEEEDFLERYYIGEALKDCARGIPGAMELLSDILDEVQDTERRRGIAEVLSVIALDRRRFIERGVGVLIQDLEMSDRYGGGGREAVECLERIASENIWAKEVVVQRLVDCLKRTRVGQILTSCDQPGLRWNVAYVLARIAPGFQEALDILVEVFCAIDGGLLRDQIHADVKRVGKCNPGMVNGLLKVIQTTQDENRRWRAISLLESMDTDQGNSRVVDVLCQLLLAIEEPWMRLHVAEVLGKVEPGHREAVEALRGLMWAPEPEPFSSIRESSAKVLAEVFPGEREAIGTLIEILQTNVEEFHALCLRLEITPRYATREIDVLRGEMTRAMNYGLIERLWKTSIVINRVLEYIGEVARGSEEAICCLHTMVNSIQDEALCLQAVYVLGLLDPWSPMVFGRLTVIAKEAQPEKMRIEAVSKMIHLAGVMPGMADNPRRRIVRQSLEGIIPELENEHLLMRAVNGLAKVDPGNALVLSSLMGLLQSESQVRLDWIIDEMKKLLQINQLRWVVRALQGVLMDLRKSDSERFEEYLGLLWFCAENLDYPDFYRARQGQSGVYQFGDK
jgi:hypothetical protein